MLHKSIQVSKYFIKNYYRGLLLSNDKEKKFLRSFLHYYFYVTFTIFFHFLLLLGEWNREEKVSLRINAKYNTLVAILSANNDHYIALFGKKLNKQLNI